LSYTKLLVAAASAAIDTEGEGTKKAVHSSAYKLCLIQNSGSLATWAAFDTEGGGGEERASEFSMVTLSPLQNSGSLAAWATLPSYLARTQYRGGGEERGAA